MKTYNSPITQIMDCKTSYMLMAGNVSGDGLKGIGDANGDPIEIF